MILNIVIIFSILQNSLKMKCGPFNSYEEGLIDNINPQEQVNLNIQMGDKSRGESFGFGLWIQFIPLWNLKQQKTVDTQFSYDFNDDGQFIMLVKSNETQENILVYYVQFNSNIPSITHKLVSCISEQSQANNFKFPPLQYEGIWIFTYFIIQPSSGKLIIEMTNQDSSSLEIAIPEGEYLFILGGRGQVSLCQQGINLNNFSGRLSKLIYETQFFNSQNNFRELSILCKIPQQAIGEQTYYLVPSLQQYGGDTLQQFVINEIGNRYCISGWIKVDFSNMIKQLKQVMLIRMTAYQEYGIETQMGDELLRIMIEAFFDVYPTPDYADLNILVNLYNIPVQGLKPPADVYQYFLTHKHISGSPYISLLQQWHFIQYEYGRTSDWRSIFKVLFINQPAPISVEFGDSNLQGSFTNTKFYIYLGGDEDKKYSFFSGYISNFKITYNFEFDKDFMPTCHYSCLTCDGPFRTNCKTCPLNSNRQYLFDQGICQCEDSYIENENESTCSSFDKVYSSVQQTQHSEQHTVKCELGYFYLPQENDSYQCSVCPQSSKNQDIICVNCLFYPLTWYIKPICTTDLVSEGEAYLLKNNDSLDYDLYLIDPSFNLQLQIGVKDFCEFDKSSKQQCHPTTLTHLQNFIHVICKDNYYFYINKCIRSEQYCILSDTSGSCMKCQENYYIYQNHCHNCPAICNNCVFNDFKTSVDCINCPERFTLAYGECKQCGKFCQICSNFYDEFLDEYYLRCYRCIDDSKYFVSFDAINCIENPLQFCLFAFQMLKEELVTTLDYYFIPQYEENSFITLCAKCDNIHVFILPTLACEDSYVIDIQCNTMISPTIDVTNNDPICLMHQFRFPGTVAYNANCPSDSPNCGTCIEARLGFIQCLICQEGFYSNRITGVCFQCPEELNCQKCYQENKHIRDYWKISTQPFYQSYINIKNKHSFTVNGLSQNVDDYEIVCSACKLGYEIYGSKCILKCPQNCKECKLIDGENICVKCFQDQFGRQLSLSSNSCLQCPSNCALCRIRSTEEIYQINSLFTNKDYLYSTYQCLRPYQDFDYYYDQYLGQYIDCQPDQNACLKQFEILMNLYCSSEEYYNQLNSYSSEIDKLQFQQQNTYVGDLFFNNNGNSFQQFEQPSFYFVANQKQIQTIIIRILSNIDQDCFITGESILTQQFSANIFTAIDVRIFFISSKTTRLQFDNTITFQHFTFISITGFTFQPITNIRSKQMIFSGLNSFTLEFMNVQYNKLLLEQDDSSILINNIKSLFIENFTVYNLKRNSNNMFFKVNGGSQLQTMEVNYLSIINCQIINQDFMSIYLNSHQFLNFNNINVTQSTFINGKLLSVSSEQGATFQLQNTFLAIKVEESLGLIDLEQLAQVKIQNFEVANSVIMNSIVLLLCNVGNIQKITIQNCEIKGNTVVIANSINSFSNQIIFNFFEFFFFRNTYEETIKFMRLEKFSTKEQIITFESLSLSGNVMLKLSDEHLLQMLEQSLVYIQFNFIEISKLLIERGVGLSELTFIDCQSIKITSLQIIQHVEFSQLGIHQYLDCLLSYLKTPFYPPSLYIYSSKSTTIMDIKVIEVETLNYPLIQFLSKELSQGKQQETITIEDGVFQSNLLLLTNLTNGIALLNIQSQQKVIITLKNLRFSYNILHEYMQQSLISSATLINIICIQCTLKLKSSTLESNIVINSTDSIMYLKIKTLTIENCLFRKNTKFQYEVIKPRIIWGFNNDQIIYLEQLMIIFKVISFSGNGVLIGESIEITNCSIIDSSGSKGGAFWIMTQNQAIFTCSDTQFQGISTFFIAETETGGIFSIDTSSALSSIIALTNIFAQNIYCRAKGGILYLNNGEAMIKISLQQFSVVDVYSKIGSIIYCQFFNTFQSQQNLEIKEFTISNSQEGQAFFLRKFTDRSNLQTAEIYEISDQRTLIYCEFGTDILIQNIKVYNLKFEAMIIGLSFQNIIIDQVMMMDSSFSTNLITLQPAANQQFQISIHFFQVFKASLQHFSSRFFRCFTQANQIPIVQFICLSNNNNKLPPDKLQTMNDNPSTIQDCFKDIVPYNTNLTSSGVINISIGQTTSNFNIFISNLLLNGISCTNCNFGLLSLLIPKIISSTQSLKIESLTIINNNCGLSSCLIISTNSSLARLLTEAGRYIETQSFNVYISKYICVNNTAQYGTCLMQDISSILIDCVFRDNLALNKGGAILVRGEAKNIFILDSQISNNKASIGGGIYSDLTILPDFFKMKTTISSNVATIYGNQSASVPIKLAISKVPGEVLTGQTINESSNISISELGSLNSNPPLYLPSGRPISEYYYFDWKLKSYIYPYLQFRILSLDQNNVVQQNLIGHYCRINSRIFNMLKVEEDQVFTNNLTNKIIYQFDNNTQDFNLDDLILSFDSESPPEIVLQLEFWCSSIQTPIFNSSPPYNFISSHSNYYLRVNIRTFPCQYGEIKNGLDSSCSICDAKQDQFSLQLNGNKCQTKDDLTTISVKSAQLQLRETYWRPYFDTAIISYCLNLPGNCLGGWVEGDNSCIVGHIGALCEQCDVKNIRGDGQYAFSSKYQCSPCSQYNKNIIIMIVTVLWTFLTLYMSVRGNLINVQKDVKKAQIRLLGLPINQQAFAQSGILIKMLTNYLQIISSLQTFQLKLPQSMNDTMNAFGNPIQSMSYSQDCILAQESNFEIHYSRMIWQLIIPFIFISLLYLCYALGIFIKFTKFNLSVITTPIIYLYIYFQPNLIDGLIQLVSIRTISGFYWIQSNVAFRYDTDLHQQWILRLCLPFIMLLALVIPFLLFFVLYINRKRLTDMPVKTKWGYLYKEYKTSSYFWEIVKIFQKQFIIMALTYYEDEIAIKGICALVIVYIYQELNLKYHPYQLRQLNQLDFYIANISQISFALGIGIYMAYQNQVYQIQTLFYLMLAVVNIFLFLLLIFKIFQAYTKEMEEILDTVRDFIRDRIPIQYQSTYLMSFLVNRSKKRKNIKEKYQKIKTYLLYLARQILALKNNEQFAKNIYASQFKQKYVESQREDQLLLISHDSRVGTINKLSLCQNEVDQYKMSKQSKQ